ncbi:MAG TPA: YbaK/EbsC family protein [Anaerolineaceae bacterium]|nr:YbaK/EbsC family protein [Anaerolineaceae bacterium]
MNELSQSAQRVQDALHALGLPCQVIELPGSTRTAIEAAQAVNCQVGQIVKSLIFMGAESRRPMLIVASGVNRVNEKQIASLVGEQIQKADADFVRNHTGYAIGGVPPLGLAEPFLALIDEDLLTYPTVWAAAGTPHAVFELNPRELQRMTGGRIVTIK